MQGPKTTNRKHKEPLRVAGISRRCSDLDKKLFLNVN
jgi:hypothetical protein